MFLLILLAYYTQPGFLEIDRVCVTSLSNNGHVVSDLLTLVTMVVSDGV
jgi:hypothetical protein